MASPTLDTPQANASLTEGDNYSADVLANFSDADKTDSLSFSGTGFPAGSGLAVDPASGVISGTPTAADVAAAPYDVTVQAEDGASNTQSIDVTLSEFPPISGSVLWSGDFKDGDFRQWDNFGELSGAGSNITFFQCPAYGRPIQYGVGGIGSPGLQSTVHVGNGDLIALCTKTGDGIYEQAPAAAITNWDSHAGGSAYICRQTMKNSDNTVDATGVSVPGGDWDNSVSTRRRTGLTVQAKLTPWFDGLPELKNRWLSCSIFLPASLKVLGDGFGYNMISIKPVNETSPAGSSANFSIGLDADGATPTWAIENRFADSVTKSSADGYGYLPPEPNYPWQYQMFYTGAWNDGGVSRGPYPDDLQGSLFWPDGAAHFPNKAASHAALASVNLGGWTDWVINCNWDHDPAGDGFIRVWKREDQGPWVEVLHIVPGTVTRGSVTFAMGTGYENSNGYGLKAQMYCKNSKVLPLLDNFTWYLANINVGGESATFADVSPDGSVPA